MAYNSYYYNWFEFKIYFKKIMKAKNKINYDKLVKSSRDLVNNKNFRNNQNYIISDFSKFKFYRTYYRTWFNKNI
jgi:hypothetical protein